MINNTQHENKIKNHLEEAMLCAIGNITYIQRVVSKNCIKT